MMKTEKLIIAETKLEFYRELEKKLEKYKNDELDLDDWGIEIYNKIQLLEEEVDMAEIENDALQSSEEEMKKRGDSYE